MTMLPTAPPRATSSWRHRTLETVYGFAVAAVVCLCVLAATATTLRAQNLSCDDGADASFQKCLKQIGQYTQWMAVPSSSGGIGGLQNALDGIYQSVVREWPTSVIGRRYIKSVFWIIPGLLTAYLGLIWFVTIKWPLSLNLAAVRGRRPEYLATFGGLALVLLVFSVERYVIGVKLKNTYDQIPATVEHFVHLQSPASLASMPLDPCEGFLKTNDLFTAMCSQSWVPRTTLADVVRDRMVKDKTASLQQSLAALGRECATVGAPPAWWTRNLEDAEKAAKNECTVLDGGTAKLRVAAFESLNRFNEWLVAAPAANVRLELEPLLGVRSIDADAIYAKKMTSLLNGDGFFTRYVDQYRRESGLALIALAVLGLVVGATVSISRHFEIHQGSQPASRLRRNVLRLGVPTMAVLTGIGTLVVLLQ